MNDSKRDFQAAFDAGTEQKLDIVNLGGIDHALVPKSASVQSFERLMPQPNRIRANHEFHDVESFAKYFKEFEEEGTRIFVDESRGKFTVVFDCDHKENPAWGEHRITLNFSKSSEWNHFTNAHNDRKSQSEFAEFLEDHADYVVGPAQFTGANLITMAQNINIKVKGECTVEETIANGLKTLIVKDDSTGSGQLNGQQVSFPEKLELRLRIFKGASAFDISVHLRQRVNRGSMTFWISIPDIDAIIESAFNAVIKEVEEATGKECFKGSYSTNY